MTLEEIGVELAHREGANGMAEREERLRWVAENPHLFEYPWDPKQRVPPHKAEAMRLRLLDDEKRWAREIAPRPISVLEAQYLIEELNRLLPLDLLLLLSQMKSEMETGESMDATTHPDWTPESRQEAEMNLVMLAGEYRKGGKAAVKEALRKIVEAREAEESATTPETEENESEPEA
jgi:hypothetical protein